MITLVHFLTLAAILFTLGVLGIFINRKNVIVILMSIELILLSVNIKLVAFSSFLNDIAGRSLPCSCSPSAAAEAAIGLAILVIFFRNRGNHRGGRHQHDEGLRGVHDVSRVVFLPLLGFLIAGIFGRMIGPRPSEIVTDLPPPPLRRDFRAALMGRTFLRRLRRRRHGRAHCQLDGLG